MYRSAISSPRRWRSTRRSRKNNCACSIVVPTRPLTAPDHRLRPSGEREKHNVSGLSRQIDIVHEQRVNTGLAKCDDRVGGRADDRLAVVEGRIDDERHASSREETGYQLVKLRVRFASHELQPGAAVVVHDGGDAVTLLGLDRTCEQHEFMTRRVGT